MAEENKQEKVQTLGFEIKFPTKYMWKKDLKRLALEFYKNIPKQVCISILGTKSFDCEYEEFEEKVYEIIGDLLETDKEITIRENEEGIAATHAIRFAKENGFKLDRRKINWNEDGKSAPYRNVSDMVYGRNKGDIPAVLGIIFRSKKENCKTLNFAFIFEEELQDGILYQNVVYPLGFQHCYTFKL